jgi:hypothetical protein
MKFSDNALVSSCIYCGRAVDRFTPMCEICEASESHLMDWEDAIDDTLASRVYQAGWRHGKTYGVTCNRCSAPMGSTEQISRDHIVCDYNEDRESIELECEVCGQTRVFELTP